MGDPQEDNRLGSLFKLEKFFNNERNEKMVPFDGNRDGNLVYTSTVHVKKEQDAQQPPRENWLLNIAIQRQNPCNFKIYISNGSFT